MIENLSDPSGRSAYQKEENFVLHNNLYYWRQSVFNKCNLFQDSSDEEDAMRESLDPLPDPVSGPPSSLSSTNTAGGSHQPDTNVSRSVRTPDVASVALSKRATDHRRRGQLRGLTQPVPSSLPVRPSAVINLGKSIALPAVRQTGRKCKIVIFENDA